MSQNCPCDLGINEMGKTFGKTHFSMKSNIISES